MKVSIKVSGWLKKFTGGLSSLELDLPEGVTAMEAVCRAGIPREQIGFIAVETAAASEDGAGSAKTFRADESYMAAEGDIIRPYPPIMGG